MHRTVFRILATLAALALWLTPALSQADPLRLASPEDPPFAVLHKDRVTGISAEILRAAFARLDRPLELFLVPGPQVFPGVESGQFDGVFGIFRTPEREKLLVYGQESLADQVVVLMARKDANVPDAGLDELKRFSLGVVQGVSYGPRLDRFLAQGGPARVETAATPEENLNNLLARRVDLAAMTRYGAMTVLERLGRTEEVREIAPPLDTQPSFAALSAKRADTALLASLDAVLADMKRDGTIQNILEAWFMDAARGDRPAAKADKRAERKKPK